MPCVLKQEVPGHKKITGSVCLFMVVGVCLFVVVGGVIEKQIQSQPSQGTELVADQLNSQPPAFSESCVCVIVSENHFCRTNSVICGANAVF